MAPTVNAHGWFQKKAGAPGAVIRALTERRFNQYYNEAIKLENGVRLQVRMVRAVDKRRLKDGFGRLSATSRYRRFLAHRKDITPEELRFFTEVDGESHLALVAVQCNDAGQEDDVIGVARLLRVADDSAEFSLAVTDDMQRRGVGRILLARLLAAATERGIAHLRGHMHSDNHGIANLVRYLCPTATFRSDGALVDIEISLGSACPELAKHVAHAD